jgi:hypothetical protein
MKIIEDYLKHDLERDDLKSWQDIRIAYMEKAVSLIKNDWQSPAYRSSIENQAGRRAGKIIGNINDYTRDQHDLSLSYEQKFVKEYLPRVSLLPLEAYVTSSGMAALTTVIVMLQRLYGVDQTVMVGKHSYFQNFEILTTSFTKVILFDETNIEEWRALIDNEQPRAIFIDSLCNEPNLTRPPVEEIVRYLKEKIKAKTYLVIDNTMMATNFDWRKILRYRSQKLDIIGWESLNKYYQFGLDRVTGGILWGSGWLSVQLNQARRHAGTIMPDFSVAMLPTPSSKIMKLYLERIRCNRVTLQQIIGLRGISDGAQVVIKFGNKMSYEGIQKIIKKIIKKAENEGVQIAAGSSFGLPSTRIYLTARQSKYTQMFLRISVGVEEASEFEKIAQVIAFCL